MNEPLWTFVYVLNFSLCMFLFLFGTHLEVGLLNHVQVYLYAEMTCCSQEDGVDRIFLIPPGKYK